MSNDNVIGADEMQVWRADRVTRKFLEFVTSKREYVLNGLERGEFLNMENPYVTHANIAMVARLVPLLRPRLLASILIPPASVWPAWMV
jgi:hypothetical protein